jgi:hypothetical protein
MPSGRFAKPCLHDAGLRTVVACKHFQFAAVFLFHQHIKETLNGRQIEVPAADDEVEALTLYKNVAAAYGPIV